MHEGTGDVLGGITVEALGVASPFERTDADGRYGALLAVIADVAPHAAALLCDLDCAVGSRLAEESDRTAGAVVGGALVDGATGFLNSTTTGLSPDEMASAVAAVLAAWSDRDDHRMDEGEGDYAAAKAVDALVDAFVSFGWRPMFASMGGTQ